MTASAAPRWVDTFFTCFRELPRSLVNDLRSTPTEALPWLVRILDDEERLERERPAARHAQRHAAKLLAEFGNADVVPTLVAAFVRLARTRGGVRGYARRELHDAVVSFGAIAAEHIVQRLKSAEADDDKSALAELLVALAEACTPPSRRLLATSIAVYDGLADVDARRRLVEALAWSPRIVIDDRFSRVAEEARRDPLERAQLLARLADPRGVDVLIDILDALPRSSIWEEAVRGLQTLTCRSVLEALHQLHCRCPDRCCEQCIALVRNKLGTTFVGELDRWLVDCHGNDLPRFLSGWPSSIDATRAE